MPLKVLIADDHALLRQGLRQLLGDENPITSSRGDGFNSAHSMRSPPISGDLLLIDLGMPGMCRCGQPA